jgi:hypothetical protein
MYAHSVMPCCGMSIGQSKNAGHGEHDLGRRADDQIMLEEDQWMQCSRASKVY